jgi:hypothetical protein
MKLDRIAIAVAIALAFAANASAATVCVQNKQTGLYEPRTPTAATAADCVAMNPVDTAALVRPTPPAIASAPSPAAASSAAAPVAPTPASKKTWEVRLTDGTVYGTLKRWSKDAGMQLMWETENHDLRLRGQATYSGDFDVAIHELMQSVEHSDYPMRACIYDNGAVRIVHTKKSCKG